MRTIQNKRQIDLVDEIDSHLNGYCKPKHVQRTMGPYGLVSIGDTVTVRFFFEHCREASRAITAKVLSIIIDCEDNHWIYVRDILSGDTYFPLINHVWRNE